MNYELLIMNYELSEMSMETGDIDILALLPHRPPLILVDQLVYFDQRAAKTVFTVHEANLFCKDGRMEEAGFVENIAQTCAAHTGFKQYLRNNGANDKIKIGVIAMIHSLEINRRPLTGEVLETSMVIEEEVFSTTLVRSEVKIGNEPIATCKMKLFLTEKMTDNRRD